MQAKAVYRLQDISYARLGKFPALCNVSLEIFERESIALIGANGSGKSSLLQLLNGIAFPQGGDLHFLGRVLTEEALQDEEFNAFFRRTVGLVFQNSDIQLFSPTVWDEIAFGPLQLGLTKEEVEHRVNDLLQSLGIQDLKERAPYQLSGGEKKKVAIAATLAVNPDVLLLDEPTNGLDPRTQVWLIGLLEDLRRAGKTIVIASHDLDLVERVADRVVILNEQHAVAARGLTAEILENKSLLLEVNLIHEHLHSHGMLTHHHPHGHFPGHGHSHEKNGH